MISEIEHINNSLKQVNGRVISVLESDSQKERWKIQFETWFLLDDFMGLVGEYVTHRLDEADDPAGEIYGIFTFWKEEWFRVYYDEET